MNANFKRVPAHFAPDTRFEVVPLAAAPFRAVVQNGFEELQGRLLAERLGETRDAELYSRIRGAANEAASLAWATSYPLLVFPVLFQEKAESVLLAPTSRRRPHACAQLLPA